jgi:magnesium transporter
MIQVHVFRKGLEVRDVPVEDLSQVRTEPQTLVWVDLVSPTADELAAMGREFELHEMALASCAVGEKQRPRVEEYDGQVLLIAYAAKPVGEDQPIGLHELDVVAGRNYLLTFHGGAPIDATQVARRVAARPELAKHGAGFLLYVVLDEVVDTFFPALDRIGERIEDLEEAVFEGTGEVQSQIFSLRRDLIAIRRVAGPMRDAMIVLLRRDLGLFSRESQRYLQDIYDHMIRIVESVEDYQDLAAGRAGGQPGGRLQPGRHRRPQPRRLRRHLRRGHDDQRRLRDELRPHAGARLALRLRLGAGLMVVTAGGLWVYFKRKGWL